MPGIWIVAVCIRDRGASCSAVADWYEVGVTWLSRDWSVVFWRSANSFGSGWPGRLCLVCSLITTGPDFGWKRAIWLISLLGPPGSSQGRKKL
ncbi:MAG: hypothetical protein GX616_09610 [Planctomycetes bacterium]|nr:hypothetical protein [Planctomycetota bacterium]